MPAKKPRKRPTYIPRPNAVCITIHSQDGAPVPRRILDEAARRVTDLALENGLLINLAET